MQSNVLTNDSTVSESLNISDALSNSDDFEGYSAGVFEELMQKKESNLGKKFFFNGTLDSLSRFTSATGRYELIIDLNDEDIIYLLMNTEPLSDSQFSNIDQELIRSLSGKQGVFFLEYWGDDSNTNWPVCLLDKMIIDEKTYDRDDLTGKHNIPGTKEKPAEINQEVYYSLGWNDASITLVDTIRGDEALQIIQQYHKEFKLDAGKEIIMA